MGSSGILDAVGNLARKSEVVNAAETLIESGEHHLMRGGFASKLLATQLRKFERTWQVEAEKTVRPLVEGTEKIAKDKVLSAQYYEQLAQGKAAKDVPTALHAAKVDKISFGQYLRHATAGFKVAPPVRGFYFTEMYPPEMFVRGTKENGEAIALLVKKGKAKTPSEALNILERHNPLQIKNPLSGKFHPIQSTRRLDLPELARKDAAVPLEYISGAIRSFHEKTTFGESGEKLRAILEAVRKEEGPASFNYASSVASSFLGHNPDMRVGSRERAIQSFEVATKLGRAVVAHPGKFIEPVIFTGLKPYIQTLGHLLNEKEDFKEFGMSLGSSLLDTIHEVRQQAGAEAKGLGGRVLKATGFNKMIHGQHIFVGNLGKYSAISDLNLLKKDAGNKNAWQRLATLGINVREALNRGQLTPEEEQQAGRKLTNIFLGGRTVLDLPPSWKDNATGRILTMFKPFFYNQTKIIKDFVVKPALRGDMKPLLYALAVYPTMGEITYPLRSLLAGRNPNDSRPDWDEHPYDRYIFDVSQAGGFGMMADVANALTSATPESTYRLLTGPVLGDIVDLSRLILHPHFKNLEKELLRKIPVIGSALAEHFAPSKHHKGLLEKGTITHGIEKVFDK